jgi:outer membrane usher protein
LRDNPLLQVNGPYGSYSADLQGQFNEQNWQQRSSSYQVSAAGAMVYAGGHFGLSRPVSGSFATVQVEGVADIKVLLNNQEAARTNANGMAYIPNLQSYQENKISFDDKQIDPNYLIKRYSVVVTPGLFGGKCIYFPAAKVQAYGGRLSELDGEALEYAKVRVQGAEGEFSFTTLSGGEFYFENMADSGNETGTRVEACGEPSPYRLTVVPGHYTGTVAVDGQERHFEIQIPLSDAMFVPLGNIQVPDSEH